MEPVEIEIEIEIEVGIGIGSLAPRFDSDTDDHDSSV